MRFHDFDFPVFKPDIIMTTEQENFDEDIKQRLNKYIEEQQRDWERSILHT